MNLSQIHKTVAESWVSRGCRISQSAHHKEMFIVSFPDGGFYATSSTYDLMLMLHPRDKDQELKPNPRFKFVHTSNYMPTKMTVEQMNRRIMGQRAHGKN